MSFKKICVAKINGGIGSGDFEDKDAPPSFVKIAKYWNKNQNQKGGERTCEMLSKHLKANFVPENIPELEKILSSLDDVDAKEVFVTSFNFSWSEDPQSNIPAVNAIAIFELDFKTDFSQEDLQKWEDQIEDNIAFCVNFYWNFADIKLEDWESYLDTNSGVEFQVN